MTRQRIRIGHIDIDVLTFAQALDAIEQLIEAKQGGTVFTPNVDHIVNAENDMAFRDAYRHASLSLVDGQPLVWTSHLRGKPLPEKISGSDLVLPLLMRAAKRHWRVYLFGAGPGVAETAAKHLRERVGVDIVGVSAPRVDIHDIPSNNRIAALIRQSRPDIVLVALGSPKQELFIRQIAEGMKPAVFIGVGASLDFLAGTAKRAPRWMSEAGLEWCYRLVAEPRRLWRRYLLNDAKFLSVLLRQLRAR